MEINFEFDFEPVDQCPLCMSDKKQQYHTAAMPTGGTANYVRCTACGMVYLDPAPTPDSLQDFYCSVYLTPEYRKLDGAGSPDPKQEIGQSFRVMEENADFLEEFKAPPGRLLDIGCSHGAFLIEAASRGWAAEGIEPFEDGVRFCRENLRLNVRAGEFMREQFEPGVYDVITMWEVLEHLRDMMGAMRKAVGLLKPGGVLLATSPNAVSPVAILAPAQWIGWKPPTHLQFLDYNSARRILANVGLEPLKIKSGGGYIGRLVMVGRKPG